MGNERSTPDTEKLKKRNIQNSRQVKETYIQEHSCNMVAGGGVKDDGISCFILTCFNSVTVYRYNYNTSCNNFFFSDILYVFKEMTNLNI